MRSLMPGSGGRPQHAQGTVLRQDADGRYSLRSGAGGCDGYLLNETALALWELCDGETTLQEMVSALSELFSADPQRIRQDVIDVLSELEQAQLLEWTTAPHPASTPSARRRPSAASPTGTRQT